MGKEIIGVTSSGLQEKCKWNFISEGRPCPRHSSHIWKDSFTQKLNKITEDELEDMYSFGRDMTHKVTVEDYEILSYENDSDPFDDYSREVEEPMALRDWKLSGLKMSVPTYIEIHGNRGETLNKEIEEAYMNGGCAVYAIALSSLHPEYELAIDLWKIIDDDEQEYNYDHVFCIDPKTNHAFDVRGEFESPESLMNYYADRGFAGLIHKEGENYKDLGYIKFSREDLRSLIDEGNFTWDDSPEDVAITKQLIKSFKKRINLNTVRD